MTESNNRQRTPLQELVSKATESAIRSSSPGRILQSKYAESYVNYKEQVQYQSPMKSLPADPGNKENNVMSSPMQWISPVTPPPSFTSVRTPAKCKNPFDANLTEHLHLETFSPSVFSQVLSPSDDNDSNWRIEHVALLNPTDFSPNFHSHMADPATEAEAQEKILQFFSQKQIAPSPWSQPRSRVLNRSKSKTPAEVSKPTASSKNAWTQTCLSFPPKLPHEVEEILRQYCTNEPQEDTGHSPVGNSSESEDSSLLNASSLRRKLFSQMGNTPSKGEEFGPGESRSRSSSPILRTGPLSSRFSFSPCSTRPISPPVLSPIGSLDVQHESCMAVDENTRQSWDLRQSSTTCGCPMETYEAGCLNCSTSTVVQSSSRMDLADNSGFGLCCKPVECSTPTKSKAQF